VPDKKTRQSTAAHAEPPLTHRRNHFVQRQLWMLGNQRQQPVPVLLQWRDASAIAPAPQPVDHRTCAHFQEGVAKRHLRRSLSPAPAGRRNTAWPHPQKESRAQDSFIHRPLGILRFDADGICSTMPQTANPVPQRALRSSKNHRTRWTHTSTLFSWNMSRDLVAATLVLQGSPCHIALIPGTRTFVLSINTNLETRGNLCLIEMLGGAGLSLGPDATLLGRIVLKVIAMMKSTPNAGSEGAEMPHEAGNQTSIDAWYSNQLGLHADLPQWQFCEREFVDTTVQISPIESVKRHSTGWHALLAESIYAPTGSRVEFRLDASVHLLVIYEEGARSEGETSIDGLVLSRLRKFANKLTFVPAGHAYHEWYNTSTPTRVTFLYLDPAKIQESADADATYEPRACFEDAVISETAAKLKNVIESSQLGRTLYLEALAKVLGHELSRSNHDLARSSVNRGGLASWQKRAVIGYVQEHLGEQTSLVTLARLTRLSQHHFCRAFKQSFGIPPYQYHVQRRIDRAKVLLADGTNSITDVGLILGYSQTSSFSVAFRKITGRTPREFRRDFSRLA
jgi:AraC family transcriptional regulator